MFYKNVKRYDAVLSVVVFSRSLAHILASIDPITGPLVHHAAYDGSAAVSLVQS